MSGPPHQSNTAAPKPTRPDPSGAETPPIPTEPTDEASNDPQPTRPEATGADTPPAPTVPADESSLGADRSPTTDDRFDPSRLRLSQNFAAQVGVEKILTFNVEHFKGYEGIDAVPPNAVVD